MGFNSEFKGLRIEEHYVYSPIHPQSPELARMDKSAVTIFTIFVLEKCELRTSSAF